jgi:hypothetical protein
VDDQPGGNGAAAWLAGIAVQDLLAREELVLLDRPTATWIAGGVTPEAVVVAEAVVDALGPPYGMWLVVATSLVVWRWGDRAAAMRVIVAAVLTAALAVALASVLPTSVDGTRFPGIAVSWLTATLVVAVPQSRCSTSRARFASLALEQSCWSSRHSPSSWQAMRRCQE